MMSHLRQRTAAESGISIVEVLVAALILTISALAIATLANSASHNTFRTEQDQVAINRLQEELEHIRQLPFNEVALSSRPVRSDEAGSPDQRVSVDGTHFDLNRNGTNPKRLAYAGGTTPDGKVMGCGGAGQPACAIDPGPQSFQSGGVQGKIYRYVVYPGVPADCTGCSADYFKRVIVVVRIDATPAGGTHTYQEIQSNVSSPDAVPSSNPVDPTQTTDYQIAMFWLTDTPCSNTSRIAPSEHATHNTLGRCTDGGTTGSSRGAPDLMLPGMPDGSGTDPTYDYSTDIQRDETQKFGLAMLKTQSTPGCALQALTDNGPNRTLGLPPTETTPTQLEMHTWVTNQLSSTFATLTTADATLELWTKSLGGASYPGDLCVYVFKRITVNQHVDGAPDSTFVVDAPATINLAHPYLEVQRATWPQTWTKISTEKFDVTMLSADEILAGLRDAGVPGTLTTVGQRLGVALSVERDGTGGDALDVMYDHPIFNSRFELDTPRGTCVIPCT